MGRTCPSSKLELEHLIAYPEEIYPCPVWSEEEIEQARVCQNLFGYKQVRMKADRTTAIVGTEGFGRGTDAERWPNLKPGQTVKLSEIK